MKSFGEAIQAVVNYCFRMAKPASTVSIARAVRRAIDPENPAGARKVGLPCKV